MVEPATLPVQPSEGNVPMQHNHRYGHGHEHNATHVNGADNHATVHDQAMSMTQACSPAGCADTRAT